MISVIVLVVGVSLIPRASQHRGRPFIWGTERPSVIVTSANTPTRRVAHAQSHSTGVIVNLPNHHRRALPNDGHLIPPPTLGRLALDSDEPIDLRYSAFTSLQRAGF